MKNRFLLRIKTVGKKKKKEKPLSEIYMAMFIFRHWKQLYLLPTN